MMKFRNIESTFSTENYGVNTIHHSKDERTLEIKLSHGCFPKSRAARILFKGVIVTRFTPLNLCMTEYNEAILKFYNEHPKEDEKYCGIMEIVGKTELKDRAPWTYDEGYKHYLIITEDEYVEVLAKEDPVIEDFSQPNEKKKNNEI